MVGKHGLTNHAGRSHSVEGFVEVPGGRLFVADDGAGPAIVMLHARIVDQRAWDPIVPGILATGYRAIRYDARGFGRTETDDVEFSNRADVIAVLDSVGINRAVLVGNSGGGQVAFDTAIEFPERVVAVVGVGAGIGGFDGEPTAEEMALFEEDERLQDAEPRDVDAIVDLDVRLWLDGPGQQPDRVDAPTRAFFRSMDEAIYVPGRQHGRSCSNRLRTIGWRICAAPCWRWPVRSTSRMSPRRHATWKPTPRTPRR